MSRISRFICLIVVVSLSTSSVSHAVGPSPHPFQEALTSPKGVAVVACVYAVLNGFANWVWAYNWTRAGASAETNSRAQEAGGLTAAVLSWTIGAIIPVYTYLFLKHMERHKAQSTAQTQTAIQAAIQAYLLEHGGVLPQVATHTVVDL